MEKTDFFVSVVIPVYNAEKFLRRAVLSALQQPETGEVVLVEDCALDNSLAVCEALLAEFPEKIRILRHPDGRNHGAGLSRNVGIHNARFNYIAFLDADDYYLQGRFTKAKEVLLENPDLDGVYDTLGLDLSDEGSAWWKTAGNYTGLVTIKSGIPPKNLFQKMDPVGTSGSFHADTILVHKRLFEKTGCAFSELSFGEDTLLWMQFAACGMLSGGELKAPVAMRGVHGSNSIRRLKDSRKNLLQVFSAFEEWAAKHPNTAGNETLLACARLRLSYHWAQVLRIIKKKPCLLCTKLMWRSLFRWVFIRQFPEDPFLPGFFPKSRRKDGALV